MDVQHTMTVLIAFTQPLPTSTDLDPLPLSPYTLQENSSFLGNHSTETLQFVRSIIRLLNHCNLPELNS